jgi:hypothetical protein
LSYKSKANFSSFWAAAILAIPAVCVRDATTVLKLFFALTNFLDAVFQEIESTCFKGKPVLQKKRLVGSPAARKNTP